MSKNKHDKPARIPMYNGKGIIYNTGSKLINNKNPVMLQMYWTQTLLDYQAYQCYD